MIFIGGWGYLYVNLVRALRDLYHNLPNTNLLTIANPERDQIFPAGTSSINVEWHFIGIIDEASVLYTVKLDGIIILANIKVTRVNIPIGTSGQHVVSVLAQDVQTAYPLSVRKVDSVPTSLVHLVAVQSFFIR